MNPQYDIQQVEVSLEEAKKIVAFGEALGRLENNRDFQTVVIDGYMKDEASRLVMCSALTHKGKDFIENTLQSIRAIGELRQYLLARRASAEQAASDIREFEQALDEMHEEG